jgi:AcrR family transcriptional regulator
MGDAAESKKKLIEVAMKLFSTNGFKGTSIRDIAKLTGMTISNIYYYFGSKYGLLLAILEYLSMGLQEELIKAAEAESDPIERFKWLVKAHLDQVGANEMSARLFFLDEEELSPAVNEINKKFQTGILNVYRSELQKLKDAGYIPNAHISVLAFHILGVIQWHLRWYREDGPLSFEQIKEEALNFILYGIVGDSAPHR